VRRVQELLPLDPSTFATAFWVQIWFETCGKRKQRAVLRLSRRRLAQYREAGAPTAAIEWLAREIATLEEIARTA
jgi:hypothetical protein